MIFGKQRKQIHSNHTGYIFLDNKFVCKDCGYPLIFLTKKNKYTPKFEKDLICYCSNSGCKNHEYIHVYEHEKPKFKIFIDRYMYEIK